MDVAAERGRNTVRKQQIHPLSIENEQADAGRDGRTRTGDSSFPCSADHDQDWQPYPVDPYYSATSDDQTYINK